MEAEGKNETYFKLTLIVIAISMLSSLSVMSFFIYKIVNLNHRTVENTDRILRENYDRVIKSQVIPQ
jgi:uncharacterized membrane protein YukC